MTALTLDQREYKEKTLAQLQLNSSLLETKLGQESRADIADNIRQQFDDIQAHIDRLQHELATNTAGEAVADDLFQRVAGALTNKKFYLAKKLINKLETIEPFYPGLERLRQEAEAGRVSRRTRAIVERPHQSPTRTTSSAGSGTAVYPLPSTTPAGEPDDQTIAEEPGKKGLAQFLQLHIILSCLVVSLILCIMSGVGGFMLLQWLIEGG